MDRDGHDQAVPAARRRRRRGLRPLKMASLFLLPLLMLAFKVALIVAFVMLAVWFFKRNDKPKDDATAG